MILYPLLEGIQLNNCSYISDINDIADEGDK